MSVYTDSQLTKIWQNVAYNDSRLWAFYSHRDSQWHHPKNTMTLAKFCEYVYMNNITDIHVKACLNNIGREWVIDLDFHEDDTDRLQFKMQVGKLVFKIFFGSSVHRILFSGNRGLHIWLKISKFAMSASQELRRKYYKAFVLPKVLRLADVNKGSFISAVLHVIKLPEIQQSIARHYPSIQNDTSKLVHELCPPVDELVFCNLNQIRAPYSYNYKGKNFSSDY